MGARENKSKYANKQKGLILMKDRSQERRIKMTVWEGNTAKVSHFQNPRHLLHNNKSLSFAKRGALLQLGVFLKEIPWVQINDKYPTIKIQEIRLIIL